MSNVYIDITMEEINFTNASTFSDELDSSLVVEINA